MSDQQTPQSREARRSNRRSARQEVIVVLEDDIVIDVEDFFASGLSDVDKKRVGEQIRNLMTNVNQLAQNRDAASLGGNVLALGSGSDDNTDENAQMIAIMRRIVASAQDNRGNPVPKPEFNRRLQQAMRIFSGQLEIDTTDPTAPRLLVEKELADAGSGSGAVNDDHPLKGVIDMVDQLRSDADKEAAAKAFDQLLQEHGFAIDKHRGPGHGQIVILRDNRYLGALKDMVDNLHPEELLDGHIGRKQTYTVLGNVSQQTDQVLDEVSRW